MYKDKFNRTKIIATIGPSSKNYETLKNLVIAGVDVCRLNFSHGEHAIHKETIETITKINEELNSNVCILADLQGPKLRVGDMGEGVLLKTGENVKVTNLPIESNKDIIYVLYDKLVEEVKPNESILLDDGNLELKVLKKLDGNTLLTEIIGGGLLKSRKGFNLPQSNLSVPALTPKDLIDLAFALEQNVEWIGLSFVRKAQDILDLRELITAKGKKTRIVAKIEKPEAVEDIDAIIKATDAVMVARGDLGVEIAQQKVPLIQKEIVDKCIRAAKPVIIATQMMESMIENPRPTRAEVNDVANAVLDGADAVMLSAETSIGKYPDKAVSIMSNIIEDVEQSKGVYYKGEKPNEKSTTFLSDEICFTAVRMSDHINAQCIIGMTTSGYSAIKISSYRPKAHIFIFTHNLALLNTLNLVWGVRGFYYDRYESTDKTFSDVLDILQLNKVVKKGDLILHTASMPIDKRSRANTIKISIVE
jgi:pyruvate kinase